MKSKKLWLKRLFSALAFSIITIGCYAFEDIDFSGKVNGTWHLIDSHDNKTGSIINISNGIGTLTAIGEDDVYSRYVKREQISIGDTLIKNIKYKGETDNKNSTQVYWTCEYNIPYALTVGSEGAVSWSNTYISYDTNIDKQYRKNKVIFLYTLGNPNTSGLGIRFIK